MQLIDTPVTRQYKITKNARTAAQFSVVFRAPQLLLSLILYAFLDQRHMYFEGDGAH